MKNIKTTIILSAIVLSSVIGFVGSVEGVNIRMKGTTREEYSKETKMVPALSSLALRMVIKNYLENAV